MVANNETGVVQPIRELAAAAHTVGALFHTDAIQGYLHIPLDVTELGVDAMTVAAHKHRRPRGIRRALTLRAARRCARASSAADRRPVVEPARRICVHSWPLPLPPARWRPMWPRSVRRCRPCPTSSYATLTAHPRIHATMGDYAHADRLPGMVSIYIDGMDSEELIIKLDAAGFEVSAGSACSSGSMDPSHVLQRHGYWPRTGPGRTAHLV